MNMDSAFGDFVQISIGLLLTAVFLMPVATVMGMSKQYNEKQLEQQYTAIEIKEQRNNLFYNNTHVYQQDIVSLVLRHKGDKSVTVLLTSSPTPLEWSSKKQSTTYKVSDISSSMPRDVLFDADLVYGPNGRGVVGYTFTEHKAGCGR